MNTTMSKNRALCAFLSLSIACSGFTTTLARAQGAGACTVLTDDPVDGCIREVKLDSPQMSVTGQSVYVPPGTEVTFTARAINQDGQPTGCARGWEFKVDGQVIDMGSVKNDTITFQTGGGSPEVAAVCKDNPSIGHAPVIVKSSVLGAPPAARLNPKINPDSVNASTSGVNARAAGGNASASPPGVGGALLLGGVVVGAAALVGAAAAASNSSSAKYCGSWQCSGSQCASVMGGWSGTKEFNSMSACQSYFNYGGATFGSSCHQC